jgi:hypothetical protein
MVQGVNQYSGIKDSKENLRNEFTVKAALSNISPESHLYQTSLNQIVDGLKMNIHDKKTLYEMP